MTSSSNSLCEASLRPTPLSRVSLTRVSRPGCGLCQSLCLAPVGLCETLPGLLSSLCVSPVSVPIFFTTQGCSPLRFSPISPFPHCSVSLSLSLQVSLSLPQPCACSISLGVGGEGGGGGAEPRLWVHLRLRLRPSPFPQHCLVGGVRGTAAPTSRGTLPRHPPFLTPFGALAAAPETSMQRLELRERD